MGLTELLRRKQNVENRLKDLAGDSTKPEWSKLKLNISWVNQLKQVDRQITQFGEGLPIFRIVFGSKKKAWIVYYQAETQDEAIAACLLHHQAEPIEIKSVNTFKLKVIKAFRGGPIE